jgi:hypothetical protein
MEVDLVVEEVLHHDAGAVRAAPRARPTKVHSPLRQNLLLAKAIVGVDAEQPARAYRPAERSGVPAIDQLTRAASLSCDCVSAGQAWRSQGDSPGLGRQSGDNHEPSPIVAIAPRRGAKRGGAGVNVPEEETGRSVGDQEQLGFAVTVQSRSAVSNEEDLTKGGCQRVEVVIAGEVQVWGLGPSLRLGAVQEDPDQRKASAQVHEAAQASIAGSCLREATKAVSSKPGVSPEGKSAAVRGDCYRTSGTNGSSHTIGRIPPPGGEAWPAP